jgi:hypothetical protein
MQTGNEYENMMITSFRAPRVAGRSGSVTFLIDMQEIVLADPVTTAPGAAVRSEPKLKPKKPGGGGRPEPVVESTTEEKHLMMSIPAGVSEFEVPDG